MAYSATTVFPAEVCAETRTWKREGTRVCVENGESDQGEMVLDSSMLPVNHRMEVK
mgnify:CR=1 FL=1|tara:strand:+ start:286 stop:453 length:168 start_codon:yes stop_codon:yes gene_type:complete